MDGGGVAGARASRREGEWLHAYGRAAAMVPREEKLAAGRARLEAVNVLQHESWEARDVHLQWRLLKADENMRMWEATCCMAQQPFGDDRMFAELLKSENEDLKDFIQVLELENEELKIKVKEVVGGVEHSPNTADHDHVARDLKAELRQLKQAYEAFCSDKDKEVSTLVAEKDSVREQLRTLERDYANLQQNAEQLRVASRKKDGEIHRLRERAKAKSKLGPDGKAQEACCMPKETDEEIEKRKDQQPGTSQKLNKDMPETNAKKKSEGSALRGETKMCSSKQMLAEDGQPGMSQKRKCVTFLSNVTCSFL